MKPIQKYEDLLRKVDNGLPVQLCYFDVLIAYRQTQEDRNALLNFRDIELTSVFRACTVLDDDGIEEITISSRWSGMLDIVEVFEECGFKVVGTAKVQKLTFNDEFITEPALHLVRNWEA